MAERENIKERIRKINPKAIGFTEALAEKIMEKTGEDFSLSNTVVTTEDMTPEEEKMAFLEYYLKQGVPFEEAEKLAEDRYNRLEKVLKLLDKNKKKKLTKYRRESPPFQGWDERRLSSIV